MDIYRYGPCWTNRKINLVILWCLNLWIIFWFPLNIRNLGSRHSLDDVREDQPVGQLGLKVLDPAAASKLVQVVVGPVRVDLDDRFRLLGSLRGGHHRGRPLLFPGCQAAEWILSRIHLFDFLFFVYFDSVTRLRLNEHIALEKNKRSLVSNKNIFFCLSFSLRVAKVKKIVFVSFDRFIVAVLFVRFFCSVCQTVTIFKKVFSFLFYLEFLFDHESNKFSHKIDSHLRSLPLQLQSN